MWLKAVLDQYKVVHRLKYKGYLEHGNSKGEVRRRRQKNTSKRVVRNMEGRNVGTKKNRKIPKQDPTGTN